MTDLNAMSQEELKEELLKGHEHWNKLRRENPDWIPNLREVDLLEAQLEKANLQGAILIEAHLEKANLQGAILIEAHLEKANLQGANLSSAQLSRTDLSGADLSETILHSLPTLSEKQLRGCNITNYKVNEKAKFEFEGLKTVEETSKHARGIFIAMILACFFCVLTLGTTDNLSLLLNSGNSTLPLLNTPIPIIGFYILAPVLLLALYLYLHVYLKNLWEELGALPAIFPDGKTLDKKAFPWLLNGLVTNYVCHLRDKTKFLTKLQNLISFLLAWWLVPITLICIWLRYLVIHDWHITGWHLVLIATTCLFGSIFLSNARDQLDLCIEKNKQFKIKRIVKSIVVVGFITLLVTFSYVIIDGPNIQYSPTNNKEKIIESILVYTAPFLPLIIILLSRLFLPNLKNSENKISFKQLGFITLFFLLGSLVVANYTIWENPEGGTLLITTGVLIFLVFQIENIYQILIKQKVIYQILTMQKMIFLSFYYSIKEIYFYVPLLSFISLIIYFILFSAYNLHWFYLDFTNKEIVKFENFDQIKKELKSLENSYMGQDKYTESINELKNNQKTKNYEIIKTLKQVDVEGNQFDYLKQLEKLETAYKNNAPKSEIKKITESLERFTPSKFNKGGYLEKLEKILPSKDVLKNKNLRFLKANNCFFVRFNLEDAKLTGASLESTNLTWAKLNNANLTEVWLGDANLTGAELGAVNLTKANLIYADLTEARLGDANLTEADLGATNLTGADLRYANLTKVNLGFAKLTEANLRYVNLTEAFLYNANLTGAFLYNANLMEANLEGVNLTEVIIDRSNYKKYFKDNYTFKRPERHGYDCSIDKFHICTNGKLPEDIGLLIPIKKE